MNAKKSLFLGTFYDGKSANKYPVGPGEPCLVKHLGIADQAIDMRFGEKISRGSYQQDVGTVLIQRQPNGNTGFFLDVFLQPL